MQAMTSTFKTFMSGGRGRGIHHYIPTLNMYSSHVKLFPCPSSPILYIVASSTSVVVVLLIIIIIVLVIGFYQLNMRKNLGPTTYPNPVYYSHQGNY